MKTIRDVMNLPIEDDILGLSVRCLNCLWNSGVKTLSELTAKSEDEFLTIRNMGHTTLDALKKSVFSLGLCFSMTDRDWLQWGLMNKRWIMEH